MAFGRMRVTTGSRERRYELRHATGLTRDRVWRHPAAPLDRRTSLLPCSYSDHAARVVRPELVTRRSGAQEADLEDRRDRDGPERVDSALANTIEVHDRQSAIRVGWYGRRHTSEKLRSEARHRFMSIVDARRLNLGVLDDVRARAGARLGSGAHQQRRWLPRRTRGGAAGGGEREQGERCADAVGSRARHGGLRVSGST